MGGCEVMWAIKDQSITRTFFDEGAATFFLPHLAGGQDTAHQQSADSASATGNDIVEVSPLKRTKYTIEGHAGTGNGNGKATGVGMGVGGALGPDWHSELRMTGKAFDEVSGQYIHVSIHVGNRMLCMHIYTCIYTVRSAFGGGGGGGAQGEHLSPLRKFRPLDMYVVSIINALCPPCRPTFAL